EECTAIEYVQTNGIFSGTAEGNLELDREINRAEVTKVMLEAFGIGEGTTSNTVFPDVPLEGEWFSTYVYRALNNEIVGGYPDGYFRPANTINRVELIRIFLEASGADYSTVPTNYTLWHDVTVTPDTQWFIAYANYAFFNDLLDNNGNLNPAQAMTRMDVIRLLYRSSLL
ncbi:S-layer homology domain-containing protein, partial [Patescibacteria group bacterium]|nr:S-layer homology domain-containing protein [Patescibacteria group bacterium]